LAGAHRVYAWTGTLFGNRGQADVDAAEGLLVVLVRGVGPVSCDLPEGPGAEALVNGVAGEGGSHLFSDAL